MDSVFADSQEGQAMRIAGAGCCLIDSIYMHCSYTDEAFKKLWTKRRGDGGLIEGGLVFSEDLQQFANKPYRQILSELVGDRNPDVVNLGGPAVVALVHAAQILAPHHVEVSFYGAVGTDTLAKQVRDATGPCPLHMHLKEIPDQRTATTEVFDDPSARHGKGDRSFINTIGAAGFFGPHDIPESFYDAEVVLLGGTALVPRLHDGMHTILEKAKQRGCITVVGTVYDFRNEKANPNQPWPLGDEPSYRNIDLLITDEEEALRLTGTHHVDQASQKLISYGVGALVITRGALDMLVWSSGTTIRACKLQHLPVSAYMDAKMAAEPSIRKDTTGCGDNFVGGVLVSLALQLVKGKDIDMVDLCAWGAASGGFACTYHGGTYHEQQRGEKARLLEPVVHAYRESVGAAR